MQPNSSGSSESHSFSDRRLQRALSHVNNLWLPVNPEVLRKIRRGLEDGVYDLNLDCLISEIKGDFALFTHCLRKLSAMLKAEGLPPGKAPTPIGLFRMAGLERLRKVLEVEESAISHHSLESMDEIQAARIGETMISACTVEALADYHEMDAELGFSASVLRQLGMTLIAWNYPGVYERALGTLKDKPKLSIDNVLSEILGFSPALLAAALVSEWGLCPEIGRVVFNDPNAPALRADSQALAKTMTDLCRVGEALARANNPDHYPSAASDWDSARSAIEASIGFEGLKSIQSKMKQYFDGYTQFFGEALGGFLLVDPEMKLQTQREEVVLKRNPYIDQCPPVLRKRFKELYSKLGTANASKECVNILVKQIVPFAGFTGGCVFTLDPGTLTLVPRLQFGTVSMNKLSTVNYDTVSIGSDPISTAFQRSTPVLESGNNALSDGSAFISGALGNSKKIGVLYLEASRLLMENGNSTAMTLYKAIRQALCDALNLS